VTLSKVEKKTKAHKNEQMQEVSTISFSMVLSVILFHNQIQVHADKWKYCWLFEVGNMRNAHLKTIRKLWKECAFPRSSDPCTYPNLIR
jgi:mRNA turnover protein 4